MKLSSIYIFVFVSSSTLVPLYPHLVEIIQSGPQGFPVVCLCCVSEHNKLHFQTNTDAYINNTEKILGVATILSGNTLDWFGNATTEYKEFCLDYAKFESELMATQ
ncbi:hypothetical protein DSO57_1004525 [Entomophthora muscae]|uniref:Uncharacterized protein n=1 Tax=Entomophthora muscae TaxID=34485 RepID=A0ACC2RMX9_9FUNG|nr:hypothetical protein DSO57_1004525 [Entomophthora muscae]